jgi:hypothetical protein
VIFSGVLLSGMLPLRWGASLRTGCGLERVRNVPWFRSLLEGPGRLPRLLLGATMGLLPCGMVYAMLAVVATLPGPAHAALGMSIFGLGTLPSLSAVLIASRIIPDRLRLQGTRIVGVTLIIAGCWMTARTLIIGPGAQHDHHVSRQSLARPVTGRPVTGMRSTPFCWLEPTQPQAVTDDKQTRRTHRQGGEHRVELNA